MTKNNKHIIPSLKQFLDYIHNRISSKKRNAFERNLQKDSFAAEAFEGLSMVDEKRAVRDVVELNKKILTKGRAKYNPYILSIAAAIALLVVTSITYLAIDRIIDSKEKSQISYTEHEKQDEEKTSIFLKEEKSEEKIFDTTEAEKPATGTSVMHSKKEAPDTNLIIIVDDDILAEDFAFDMEVMVDEKMPIAFIPIEIEESDFSGAIVAETPKERETAQAARAAANIAREESSSRKAISPVYANSSKYAAAEPEKGMNRYNKYIEKNAKIPPTVNLNIAEVVVSFSVNTNGELTEFVIIDSPSEILSEIAIEILKKGPKWNPAKIDEKLIVEEVIFTIKFQR
jgi:hypothetical protein